MHIHTDITGLDIMNHETNTPSKIDKNTFNGIAARNVACGWYHTLIATYDGSAYVCGGGNFGKTDLSNNDDGHHHHHHHHHRRHKTTVTGTNLGISDSPGYDSSKFIWTPTLIPALDTVTVERVEANRYASAALCSDGQLFTWGGGG